MKFSETQACRKAAWTILLSIVFAMAPGASAQAAPLNFFKNYIVTGDYAIGGVGLRGLGVQGYAPGTITINSVPAGADVVGAFLYWQTVEKAKSAFAGQQGFFNGHAITGTLLGNPNAPVSWSSGGCAGSSQGTTTLRTYRADVRPFLNVMNGAAQGNGSYGVRLADSGSNGGGTPLTLGATLVVIYRLMSQAAPLNAISIYDGTFAPSNSSQTMDQQIQGFYQAASTTAPVAKLTHIVGNGQQNKPESLIFNGVTLSPAAFPGAMNGSWDNPTFNVSAEVPSGDTNPVDTMVIPAATNSGCVSWGAVIFSTTVQDSDTDGLLDIWETNQGYTDPNGNVVALPGAVNGTKDIFVQLDYMQSHDFITSGGKTGHSHILKKDALDMVGKAFSNQGIQLHLDCNNCYPGDPYVIASATGGNIIDEASVACQDNPAAGFYCQFPGEAATSWKGGFTFLKEQPLNLVNYPNEQACEAAGAACTRRFQRARKDSYHYVLFGHELGLATNIWSISSGSLVSIVVDNKGTATVTTASAHNLSAGARVRVSGAVSPAAVFNQDFTLNAVYGVNPAITVNSATTFSFPTINVPAGTYNNPGLFVSSGPALSTSGWSDLGGGDTIVTLGLWRSDVPADDQVGSVLVQAGTFAHELGHTLGLQHGGTDPTNCKPNFQSVMNYLFQVRGLPGYDGVAHVDYSGQVLPDLNEGSLTESQGIGAAAMTYRTRWYAPFNFIDAQLNTVGGRSATRYCNGSPVVNGMQMVRIEGPGSPVAIDWNNDGTIEPDASPDSQDLNFSSAIDPALHGADDWTTMDLRQIGARRGVFGFSGDVWGSLDDGSGGSLDDGSGGSLDDGSGGSLDDGSGGSLDDGSGGQESDFNRANSTVDPPTSVNCTNCTGSPLVEKGHSVPLSWTPPNFGQIRTYYIWRANITNAPMSKTNLPVNIGKITGALPLATTFTDNNIKNNNTYVYFVTSALGAASGPNAGNQSGASNLVTVVVKF